MQPDICTGGSGGTSTSAAAAQLGYSRLAGEDEVAPLVAQAAELLQPRKDEDEGRGSGVGFLAQAAPGASLRCRLCSSAVGHACPAWSRRAHACPWRLECLVLLRPACIRAGKELGRSKRQRGAAAYQDLPEREFSRLCREGVEAGQAPVPLLASRSDSLSAAHKAGGRKAGPAQAASKRRRVTRQAATAAGGHEPAAAELPAAAREHKEAAQAEPAPAAPTAGSLRVPKNTAGRQGKLFAEAGQPKQQPAAAMLAAKGAAAVSRQTEAQVARASAVKAADAALQAAQRAEQPGTANVSAAGPAAAAGRSAGQPPEVAATAAASKPPPAAAGQAAAATAENRKQGQARRSLPAGAAAVAAAPGSAAGAGAVRVPASRGGLQGKRRRLARHAAAATRATAAAAAPSMNMGEPEPKRTRARVHRDKENLADVSGVQ